MRYIGVGRRSIAALVDGIILLAVSFPLGHYRHVRSPSGMTTYSIHFGGGAFLGLIGLVIVYHSIMEATVGATLGKMAMGIRVVQADGSKCTWRGAIVRDLLRVIDFLPFAYLAGAISVWSSPTRQRLGDRAGETVVIRKGSNAGDMGSGMGITSTATMNWPAAASPGGVAIPPPPPPPPVGPPWSGPGGQPNP